LKKKKKKTFRCEHNRYSDGRPTTR